MKGKHFTLVLKEVIKNEFILTQIYPEYEWVDGKQTETLKGFKCRTICPTANFDETIIKIPGQTPPLDPEKVEAEPVMVSFTDLEFSTYFSSVTQRQIYAGKATGLKVPSNKPV